MRITYDKEANAAYIYLSADPGQPVADSRMEDDHFVLDFNREGALIGLEILGVSHSGLDLTAIDLVVR